MPSNNQRHEAKRSERDTARHPTEQLFMSLLECEIAYAKRIGGHVQTSLAIDASVIDRWNTLDVVLGFRARIAQEISELLDLSIRTVLPVAKEVIFQNILSCCDQRSPEVELNLAVRLQKYNSVGAIRELCENEIGPGEFDRFADEIHSFTLLKAVDSTRAVLAELSSKPPRSQADLIDFLAAEMFARFDIACTDFGLEARREFFTGQSWTGKSPQAELQLQRLEFIAGYLMELGVLSASHRKMLQSLKPAQYEGEVCREFCKHIKAACEED